VDPRNIVASIKRRVLLTTSRCAKACFLEADGKTPTYEGARLLAHMTKKARLTGGETAFLRDLSGKIDPISMARIEGRREVVWDLIGLLKLDPSRVQDFVEVDDGRT
jgi:hypothetical protein